MVSLRSLVNSTQPRGDRRKFEASQAKPVGKLILLSLVCNTFVGFHSLLISATIESKFQSCLKENEGRREACAVTLREIARWRRPCAQKVNAGRKYVHHPSSSIF